MISPLFSVKTSPTPRLSGVPFNDPTKRRSPFCALSVNPSPRLSVRHNTPAARWKHGNGAPGTFARAGLVWSFLRLWILTSILLLEHLCPSWSGLRPWPCVVVWRLRSRASVDLSQPCLALTSFGSLASLEDTVAEGIHSLLVMAVGPTAPAHVQSCSRLHSRSRSRSPVPKRVPTRRGSILPNKRGSSTGLAVKCCLQAHGAHPCSAAKKSAVSANAARPPSLPTPRGAPASAEAAAKQCSQCIKRTNFDADGAFVRNLPKPGAQCYVHTQTVSCDDAPTLEHAEWPDGVSGATTRCACHCENVSSARFVAQCSPSATSQPTTWQ